MKLLLSSLVSSFVLIVACSMSASAQDSRSLYLAANQYREAVIHFEDEVRHVPSIDRFTLRLVDRLEDQTSELRNSTRRMTDFSRVLYDFNEIQALHPRVEDAVFGSGCPIVQAALGNCWNEVTVAYSLLATQMQLLQPPAYSSGFRGNGYGRPHCGHPLTSRNFPNTFAPVPQVAPVPRNPIFPPNVGVHANAPQASYRVPTQTPRFPAHQSDRYQAQRSDLGGILLGSFLSRFARSF